MMEFLCFFLKKIINECGGKKKKISDKSTTDKNTVNNTSNNIFSSANTKKKNENDLEKVHDMLLEDFEKNITKDLAMAGNINEDRTMEIVENNEIIYNNQLSNITPIDFESPDFRFNINNQIENNNRDNNQSMGNFINRQIEEQRRKQRELSKKILDDNKINRNDGMIAKNLNRNDDDGIINRNLNHDNNDEILENNANLIERSAFIDEEQNLEKYEESKGSDKNDFEPIQKDESLNDIIGDLRLEARENFTFAENYAREQIKSRNTQNNRILDNISNDMNNYAADFKLFTLKMENYLNKMESYLNKIEHINENFNIANSSSTSFFFTLIILGACFATIAIYLNRNTSNIPNNTNTSNNQNNSINDKISSLDNRLTENNINQSINSSKLEDLNKTVKNINNNVNRANNRYFLFGISGWALIALNFLKKIFKK